MHVNLAIDTSEGRRKFGLVIQSYKDLTPVLREFERYKRQDIAEIFETEGHGTWPARSERAEQAGWQRALSFAHRAEGRLKKKLTRELNRAIKRRGRGKGKENAVARRYFVLKEFERQVAGGRLDVQNFTAEDRRLAKSVRGLRERFTRAQTKSGERLLGRVPETIKARIHDGVLEIFSTWPVARVHNDGATVNRGAEVPARTYLEWTPRDVEFFRVLLKERGLIAWST